MFTFTYVHAIFFDFVLYSQTDFWVEIRSSSSKEEKEQLSSAGSLGSHTRNSLENSGRANGINAHSLVLQVCGAAFKSEQSGPLAAADEIPKQVPLKSSVGPSMQGHLFPSLPTFSPLGPGCPPPSTVISQAGLEGAAD